MPPRRTAVTVTLDSASSDEGMSTAIRCRQRTYADYQTPFCFFGGSTRSLIAGFFTISWNLAFALA
jgi:hypothetical protein